MRLERKKKKCKGCGEECYIFSKNLCTNCAKIESLKKSKSSKKKLPTIASLKKDARYWFQRWIRYRDQGNTCCYGSNYKLEDIKFYDACHYLKFELYPEAGFDENNVHGGSKGENIRDDVLSYRKELIRRFGEKWVIDNLENKYQRSRNTTYKWDREYLENIISNYKAKCKELESNLQKSK